MGFGDRIVALVRGWGLWRDNEDFGERMGALEMISTSLLEIEML